MRPSSGIAITLEKAFPFMPVGINAQKQGRLVCFRHAANLPKEVAERGVNAGSVGDPAWVAVLWLDRKCPTWSRWEPGLAPTWIS